jgi:deoxyribodipyrimidine photo-lyase
MPKGAIMIAVRMRINPYLNFRPTSAAVRLSEVEVLKSVLGAHSPQSAEKFIQEVFWRTYWKGWLELRPSVWANYQGALAQGKT